jgi:DNA-binding NarL/FixJ family response regulator
MAASVLVAGSRLWCSALEEALTPTAEFAVVAAAHDVGSAGDLARTHDPDVVMVTADLPGPGGALGLCATVLGDDTLRTLALLLGPADAPEYLLSALQAGALGYVTTDAGFSSLLEDLRGVVRGEARVPGSMLGTVLRSLVIRERRSSDLLNRYADLSRREREIVGLLARGLDHRGIAATLVISPQTARTHIQKVLTKLGVHSRIEAAALAIEQGWTCPEPVAES